MRLTELRLRATIRHQIRRSLNENAAKVAEVIASCIYTGCTADDIAADMTKKITAKELRDFLKTRKTPQMIKTFEDALATTGEFDVNPEDAWLEAWQSVNHAVGDYMNDI